MQLSSFFTKIPRIPRYIEILNSRIHQKRNPYIKMGKYGINYLIYPESALDYQVAKYGILNDFLAENLNQFISNDGIVFDIGANVGLLSLPFAKLHVPNGRVFAFEPDCENFSHLVTNLKLNKLKNLQVFPYAIQDLSTKKELIFNIRRSVDGDGNINTGLSSLNLISLHNVSQQRVLSSTIDNFRSKSNLKRLDFIKIDVEGAELRVLKGGIETIKKFRPIIQYEYSSTIDDLSKNNNSRQCFKLIKNLGYHQFQIVNETSLRFIKDTLINFSDSNILCFPKIPKDLNYYR